MTIVARGGQSAFHARNRTDLEKESCAALEAVAIEQLLIVGAAIVLGTSLPPVAVFLFR
jgi:hypothetical protein